MGEGEEDNEECWDEQECVVQVIGAVLSELWSLASLSSGEMESKS